MRLLLIEDDPMLGAALKRSLQQRGYTVDLATTGTEGAAGLRAGSYAAAILDLILPEMDGIEVIRDIRAAGINTPVIMLTAQGHPDQRVEGLDAGVDDYMAKPFDLNELLARVRAVIRRKSGLLGDRVIIGEIEFDQASRMVKRGKISIPLTAKELKALQFFIHARGRFVSKSELESSIYDDNMMIDSNTVEVTVYNLRKKLGSGFILTGRGLGYMLPK